MSLSKHHEILSKVIFWARDNGITLTMSFEKQDGLKERTLLTMWKNGRHESVSFLDVDEIGKEAIQNLIKEKAFQLCLTRLIL